MSSRTLRTTSTPGIYRRGSRYVVVIRDAQTGMQVKRAAPTLAAARTLKSSIQSDMARGEFRNFSPVRFADYAAEWCDTYAGRTSRGVRPQTLVDYRSSINRYAIPFFGSKQLAQIEPRDIKRFVAMLADRDLAQNTIRLQLAPLKALFATAVEDGVLRYNPTAGLRLSAGKRAQDEIAHKALTDDQLVALLAEVPEFYRPLIGFLADAGLRIGEAVALRWIDVDLDARRVHVRRRLHKGNIDAPKSRYGIRSVPISTATADQLSVLRPPRPSDDAVVFTTLEGTWLDAANLLRRVFKPAARRAGVPWAKLHTLRHTCASRLFRRGWNAKQVQLMLGHHSPAFTLSTYVHLMPDDLPDLDLIDPAKSVVTSTTFSFTYAPSTATHTAPARIRLTS